MSERWRWVVGYERLYQVSDHGQVRSVDRVVQHPRGGPTKRKGGILRAGPKSQLGHLGVKLWKDGKPRNVHIHRVVAAAWIGSCPMGQQVRHGPNGIGDNSVGNLCYGTRIQNSLDCRRDGTHGGCAVVRSDGVEFINMHVAAEESGCMYQHIWSCCNGCRKTTGSYGWRYVDDQEPAAGERIIHATVTSGILSDSV